MLMSFSVLIALIVCPLCVLIEVSVFLVSNLGFTTRSLVSFFLLYWICLMYNSLVLLAHIGPIINSTYIADLHLSVTTHPDIPVHTVIHRVMEVPQFRHSIICE